MPAAPEASPAGREDLLRALEHALSRRAGARAREAGPAPRPPGARLGRAGCWASLVLAGGLYAGGATLLDQLVVHWLTVVVFVAAITIGELFRLRMPSGREAAPSASASALAVVFLGQVYGEPTFDVDAGFVVLVVAAGLLLAAVVRGVRGARRRARPGGRPARRGGRGRLADPGLRAGWPVAVGPRGRRLGLALGRRDRDGRGRRRRASGSSWCCRRPCAPSGSAPHGSPRCATSSARWRR